MDQTILEVQDLRIHFELREGTVKALNGIDLVLKEGRTLGLVGETGAGKTTLAKGIMGLTAKPYGKIKSGVFFIDGTVIGIDRILPRVHHGSNRTVPIGD